MSGYVALLRAVNVGGTGKLPMTVLAELCVAAGFGRVRTYIASGNAVFGSDEPEGAVQAALAGRLAAWGGQPIGVLVRSAKELRAVVDANPFADAAGNRVMVLFTDEEPPTGVTGQTDEQIQHGHRAIYIFYPDGMAKSRLRLTAEKRGTSRNVNTVARRAAMAAEVG